MDTNQQTPPDDQVTSQSTAPVQPGSMGTNSVPSGQDTQDSDNVQQAPPVVSVPTISREGEPVTVSPSERDVSASVPEMEISPEMQKETGAEAVSEVPHLTPADTQAGIRHAKESVPVSSEPATTITLPMSQQQAQQTVKMHKKVKDSLFWFAMLIMRQWQMAQNKKK